MIWPLIGGGLLLLYGAWRALLGRPRVYVQSGALHGPERSVTLTDEDTLWLARALVGETGGRDPRAMSAVVWTLAQNMMLVRRPTEFQTFTQLIRAYSQPVNAAWANPASSKCLRHPSACTETRIARRRALQSKPWEQLPEAARDVALRFRQGSLSNPVPGMVDFAAYRFPGDRVNIGGNWFGVGANRRLV